MRLSNVRHISGFTLVELIVTVAVLAVLLAAAGPSFADFFERYRLRSAVDDTLTLFAQARQAAVEADRDVTVTFVGSGATWCAGAKQKDEPAAGALLTSAADPCDCNAAPGACVVGGDALLVNDASRGVTLTGVFDGQFTYDSKNGTLADLGAAPTVGFLSSTERYGLRVAVSPLGQARACVISGKRPIPGYQSCP